MCLYCGHFLIAMIKDAHTSAHGKNNQLNFGMAVPIFGETQIHTMFWELSFILPIFQTLLSTLCNHPLLMYLWIELRLRNPGRNPVLPVKFGHIASGPMTDTRALVPLLLLQSKQKVRPWTPALPLLYPENTLHLRLTTNRKCS